MRTTADEGHAKWQVLVSPQIDLKYDQPQSQIVIDHQKVTALGLNNAQVGRDLSAALGGNYVNRFNIDGRAYKVIPQVARRIA